ncbi:cyclic nucleotide-binding domain-containing protein 2-like isoform X2 [Ptychodera flava]|uniref:cyclic nucleotide-binding domain-containing protein 2-like isoform X2 n=1 Tax=Ptychodera flava TaxID=63121 RepID=UPI00396A5062
MQRAFRTSGSEMDIESSSRSLPSKTPIRPSSAPPTNRRRPSNRFSRRERPKSSNLSTLHEIEEEEDEDVANLKVEISETNAKEHAQAEVRSHRTPSASHLSSSRSASLDDSSTLGLEEYRKKYARQRLRSRRRARNGGLSSQDGDETAKERRARLIYIFQRAARLVRRVAQMGLCMTKLSKQNTTSTLVAQLHYFSADGNTHSLAFDKAKFRRAKLCLPHWARQIGTKPPHERTPEEIYKLYGVMKTMKSFEKFTQKIRLQICKMARYTCCEKGRVIVRQGHIGYNFYFIYAGSVFVQLELKDETTGIVSANTLNVIDAGQSFGELALLGDGRRTASIICREPTELFEIEKDTFLDICPEMFETEMEEKITVARKHEIFRYWPDENLQRLCFESQIQEVPHSKTIDRDTSNSPHLYFVLKGKILILREFNIRDAASRATFNLSAYKNKPLPFPGLQETKDTDLRRITESNKCFCNIGYLTDGECSDLSAIRQEDKSLVPGLILVSHGARVMKIVKQRLESLAPRGSIETFRKTYTPHIYVPCDEDLYRKYVEDIHWTQFKTKLVKTLMAEKKGSYLCHRPVTTKGSSGWAKWPGTGKMNRKCRIYQNTQRPSSTLPMSHTDTQVASHSELVGKERLLKRPKTAPSIVHSRPT